MFGLGCSRSGGARSALRTQTPHPEHPCTREGAWSTRNELGGSWGRAKETQAVPAQGSEQGTREGRQRPRQPEPCVGGNKAQSWVSDWHYKNSVCWIHKFTSPFLWMTSVSTTHGRHPRWSSFFGICSQFCEKTYKVSTSKSNLSIVMRNKYILYYFIVGSWTLTNFNIYK